MKQKYIVEKFGATPSKDKLKLYLENDLASKEDIENLMDYDDFSKFGYLVWQKYGSDYYALCKARFFREKLNTLADIEMLSKFCYYDFLVEVSNEIKEMYGVDVYNSLMKRYKSNETNK